jgi:putative transposase
MLHEQEDYGIGAACRLLELPHSTYYYRPVPVEEELLERAIEGVAGRFPTYGTRRVTHQLRRAPYVLRVNRKRVRRIMAHKGLLRSVRRRKVRTTNSQHGYLRFPNLVKGLEIAYPEHVWVSDITYIRLQHDFVYLSVILDVFTRAIRGWHLSRALDQELTLTALRRALAIGVPAIHHSDQGLHYAAHAYVELLQSHGIQISMAAVGKAEENGYAERLIRTIKEEEVYLSEYRDLADARSQIGHFIEDVYMTKRIHSSLGYLTPAEFESAWRCARVSETSP